MEQVVSVYHSLCDSLRNNPGLAEPQHSSFPAALCKTDCQLVALFAHVCRLNNKMVHRLFCLVFFLPNAFHIILWSLSLAQHHLLPELTKALYHAALNSSLNFHILSALW